MEKSQIIVALDDQFHEEPRTIEEIYDAEDEFCSKVWYDRHQCLLEREELFPPHILRQATKAATNLEMKYGKDNLGPYSDYEWGMINGKLWRSGGFLETSGTVLIPSNGGGTRQFKTTDNNRPTQEIG